MPFHCISNLDLGQFSCPAEIMDMRGASFCIKSEHYSWGLVLSQSIKLCQNDSRWKELLLPDALPSHIGLVPLSLLLSSTSLLGTQTDHLVIPACIHLCSTEAKRTKLSLAAHLARPGFFCGFTDPSLQPHRPTFSPERSERFLHYKWPQPWCLPMTLLFRMPPELNNLNHDLSGLRESGYSLWLYTPTLAWNSQHSAGWPHTEIHLPLLRLMSCITVAWPGTFMGGKEGSYCGKPSNKQTEPGITISSMLRLKHSS